MSPLILGWLLAGLSAVLLAILAVFDPKRLRNLPDRESQKRTPLGLAPRRILAGLALLPGPVLLFASQWAAFTIWLGAVLMLGWLTVVALAPRSQTD